MEGIIVSVTELEGYGKCTVCKKLEELCRGGIVRSHK